MRSTFDALSAIVLEASQEIGGISRTIHAHRHGCRRWHCRGHIDKSKLWNINIEQEYHEEKKS
jgi:hypothetical protein